MVRPVVPVGESMILGPFCDFVLPDTISHGPQLFFSRDCLLARHEWHRAATQVEGEPSATSVGRKTVHRRLAHALLCSSRLQVRSGGFCWSRGGQFGPPWFTIYANIPKQKHLEHGCKAGSRRLKLQGGGKGDKRKR